MINPSSNKKFAINFRIPAWSTNYTLTVNGVKQNIISSQSIKVERVWKANDKVIVRFDMPLQVIKGGSSYPGFIAFKRGPQVLAFDASLNTGLLKESRLESEQKFLVGKPEYKSNADLLPKQWIGKQAYTVNIIDRKKNAAKQQLIMVPFADASQTGGAIKVWMQLNIANE